jgi:SAM-dependent methyltransferase
MNLPALTPNAWLRWDIVSRLLPPEARTVLEIGCGQGSMGTRIAATTDYLGVEPDAASCAVAQGRVAALGRGEVRQGLMEDVVEPGQTFDLVCSFEVIEHIEDDVAALTGWVERVRPGGWVLLSTPAFADRYGPSDAMVGHFRRYDPAEFGALLRAAGLVDEQVVLYGAGLGNVLEKARNVIGARRLRKAGKPVPKGAPTGVDAVSMAELTAGSGRLFQPPGSADVAVQYATAPFRLLQRRLPNRGTGLVALARRPA